MMKTVVHNKIRQLTLLLLVTLLLPLMQSYAQTLPANFQRVLVTGGLTGPTSFAQLPDGRILICQQNGQLRVFKNGSLLATPAVSLSVSTSGERGLIGIAVDPAFATNKYIYLYYTSSSGPHNRVSRFTMNGDLAQSELAILDMPTLSAIYHNGGGLAFDNTGKLLVSTGDNKVGSNASNLDHYHGKVLRINTDGSVPTGNPFSGGAQRSRVWAYGLRNPFTLNVDPGTGKIYVNDVGEATWEEINDASVGGRNFGWPSKEGMCTSGCTGLTNPVYVYQTNRNDPPATGQGCAINGGAFLHGAISNWPATYHGKYFFLDYCGAWIDYINPASASPTRNGFATGLSDGLTTMKQGIDGDLYFLRRGNNSLYKIVYNGNSAPVITAHPQNVTVPQGQNATFSVTASGTPAPTYQWRKGTTNISGATAASYTITNVQASHAGSYNVVVTNSAGSVTSNNATLTVTAPNTLPVASITSPANGSSFRAGDNIGFTGAATDTEDGTLPASAYTWWVDFHHANHTHPGPEINDGVTSGSFPISVEGHTETDIWYRLYLEVTDSQGGKDTTYVEIFPVTSNLTLQTVPAGLQLTLNDIPFTTPSTQESLSGMVRPMKAPSPQTLNGTTYLFDFWAHGGAREQNITVTDNDATYTAHFKVASAPVNFTPLHDAYVRDGTNAGITHGVTDSSVLITKVSPTGQLNNARESYLMFDLTSVTSPVAAVVLRVYGKVDLTTVPSVGVGAYSVANTTWTENTLTWNNKPATSANPLSTVTVSNAAYAYYDFDVTAYVQAEKAAGRNRVAFALKSQVAHDPRIFWNSSEATANPPLLSVITDAGGNLPPTASITSPANGAGFTAPANITITATASDADGTVSKVEFFNGASKLGEATAAPYTFAWNNVPAGNYSLTAKAIDDDNASGTSAAVNITITGAPGCEPVTASADDGNVAANVLDDNLATRWSAQGDGQWIAFCLGTEQTITGVQIAFYNGNVRSSNFDIQTSSNGSTWTNVATGLSSSGNSLNLETFSIPATSTQYIRILGHGNSVNLWNSYTEVKFVTGGGSTETALPAVHDAYVRNGTSAAITHGTTDPNQLIVKMNSNPDAGNDRHTYLTFNTSSITGTVTNVKIRLYGALTDNRNSNVPLGAHSVATTSWTESTLTWNNKPAPGGTALVTTTITDSIKRFYTWDVTSYVAAEKAAGRHTVSFAIISALATNPILSFHSKETGSNAPQLIITHSSGLAPQAIAAKGADVDMNEASAGLQAFPNPFRDNITVSYTLKREGRVQLALFDLGGRQVAILADAVQSAGRHSANYKAGQLSSGLYVLKLTHNNKVITKKLMKE